jgi:nitrate reductase delta subunit
MADELSGLYRLFAGLLEYPTAALPQQVVECGDRLSEIDGRAAASLEELRGMAEQAPLARLEELYTGTFDLMAVCTPYVGIQLFGEGYKRGLFMARLNQGYRERGFSAGSELPDHVAVVLRFLALGTEGEFGQVLLREGLVPAVEKMTQAFGDGGDNPYAGVLRALLRVIGDSTERGRGDA